MSKSKYPPPASAKVWTLVECARHLRCHVTTLSRMAKAGNLPGAFRRGKIWRVNVAEFARATVCVEVGAA
jgi:hypothetical protein